MLSVLLFSTALRRRQVLRASRLQLQDVQGARRTIEITFGILAQRWMVLRRPIKAKEVYIEAYIGACIALHNILFKESTASSTAYCPPGATDSDNREGHLLPGIWRDKEAAAGALIVSRPTGCNAARYAKEVRNKLAHYFVTDGQVPWQDKVVNST
ncbi:uncharacterized protein LOC142804223 [Rhipicephalus microplus]|uniref:uncharacterized protein LOC142804223 n=1 Tax=Rhipicephalus microplus TaxID=6941 RepID=UPI003F6AB0E9